MAEHVYGCIEWLHDQEGGDCVRPSPCATCGDGCYYGARDCVYRIYQPGDEHHVSRGRCKRHTD